MTRRPPRAASYGPTKAPIPFNAIDRAAQRVRCAERGPDVAAIARETEAIDLLRGARDAAIATVVERWGFSRSEAEELAFEMEHGYFDA